MGNQTRCKEGGNKWGAIRTELESRKGWIGNLLAGNGEWGTGETRGVCCNRHAMIQEDGGKSGGGRRGIS